jgi:hypothetical protein
MQDIEVDLKRVPRKKNTFSFIQVTDRDRNPLKTQQSKLTKLSYYSLNFISPMSQHRGFSCCKNLKDEK